MSNWHVQYNYYVNTKQVIGLERKLKAIFDGSRNEQAFLLLALPDKRAFNMRIHTG